MKKNMKTKLFYMLMITMFTVIGIKFMMSNVAATGNTSDTEWYADNAAVGDGVLHKTEARIKYNSTKVYVYWNRRDTTIKKITLAPYGYNSELGLYCNATDYSTASNRVYTVSNLGKYSLTNYIYELGYTYAKLYFDAASGSGYIHGYWSPDSAGTYNILN